MDDSEFQSIQVADLNVVQRHLRIYTGQILLTMLEFYAINRNGMAERPVSYEFDTRQHGLDDMIGERLHKMLTHRLGSEHAVSVGSDLL